MILHTLSNTRVTLTYSAQEFEVDQTNETEPIGRDRIDIEFPDGSLIRVNLATGETLGTWARVFVRRRKTNISTDVFDEGGSR